jgi:hypothetical protein
VFFHGVLIEVILLQIFVYFLACIVLLGDPKQSILLGIDL